MHLKKLLQICRDHILSSADNSSCADSFMADKKCGKLTKWGCLVFHRKRLEPRVLPWQHSFCFFCDTHFWCQVWRTLLQYFQKYSLFSVLLFKLNYLWCHHFPHLHNTKLWICLKRKKIFQKRKRHSFLLWKAFQISSNYFLLHRHFKMNPAQIILP